MLHLSKRSHLAGQSGARATADLQSAAIALCLPTLPMHMAPSMHALFTCIHSTFPLLVLNWVRVGVGVGGVEHKLARLSPEKAKQSYDGTAWLTGLK